MEYVRKGKVIEIVPGDTPVKDILKTMARVSHDSHYVTIALHNLKGKKESYSSRDSKGKDFDSSKYIRKGVDYNTDYGCDVVVLNMDYVGPAACKTSVVLREGKLLFSAASYEDGQRRSAEQYLDEVKDELEEAKTHEPFGRLKEKLEGTD